MALPGNGIFVVRGEMSTLMTAMRRGSRWNASTHMDEEKDGLMKLFGDLKQILNHIEDLRQIDPNVYLAPFLEVIRTDETTGVVTGLALSSITKFLLYGLIDPTSPNLAATVENIVDAVTHARFMGTDQSSDGVTLFRVVEVLHTLMRSPEGSALTNEAVCEVMLSCFKICFEPRVNELLRRSAEQALKDMVLLVFIRLPQFSEDRSEAGLLKKFKIMAAAMEKDKHAQKKQPKTQVVPTIQSSGNQRSDVKIEEDKILGGAVVSPDQQSPNVLNVSHLKVAPLATTPATPAGNILDMQGKITQTPTTTFSVETHVTDSIPTPNQVQGVIEQEDTLNVPAISVDSSKIEILTNHDQPTEESSKSEDQKSLATDDSSEYINSVGVRFTQQDSTHESEGTLIPYGLPCIQELFRFLIVLCNPLDKQNTDTMIHLGLSLLTVAFEVSADNIGKYDTLLELVRDDLCRNLISLMNSERLTIFAADLQVCFLLFESLRGHLKFQMEAYLKKITEIISSDNPKTPYEMRELALDNLMQLWRIPGFVAELYTNYDCDLYCSDMFENLTNLLSKHTLSANNAVYSTHITAMETLILVIENIEKNCVAAKNVETVSNNAATTSSSKRHSRHNSSLEGVIVDMANAALGDDKTVMNISKFINNSSRLHLTLRSCAENSITREHLRNVKQKKRILSQGTELFNQRPDKGILYLQEHKILKQELDPMEVALFLRENPGLDKKMIGEYIAKKKNVDSKILKNFVDSFDFAGLRVDQALRLYLETFRLPGEAPLIFLVLEHFADHWHKQNNEPFANTDAAFSLAYAIIMLNMDQHNSNAKRLNVPMVQEDFLKNLRGLNGGADFEQEMLAAVFNAIKNEEIVMPAEQTGLVRENYLWKVLLRRGVGNDGIFYYVQDAAYDLEIFNLIWGASLSALSFMFDKSSDDGYQRTLAGFTKCAGISAHYNLHEDFDALILTLCKFTTLLSTVQQDTPTQAHNEIVQAVNFGLNPKAQAAIKTVFALVHDYGDSLREGWKNILDIFLQLFRLKLLPRSLTEVEDFCEATGRAVLILEKQSQKQESGLFSSLYSYLSSEGQREPSYEEQEFIKIGKKCIKDCQLDQMIQESKFVHFDSLQELIKSVLTLLKAPNAHKSVGLPYSEDVVVFWMEFLVKIVIYNRDRMIPLWPQVRDQMYLLLIGGASCGYDYLLNRSIVAVLKLAIYLMRNEELCPIVLQSLKMLLMLKSAIILRISNQISIGIYELLKTSAQNIHSEQDWQIIFTILECVGAGAVPPEFEDACLPVPKGIATKSDGGFSCEEDSVLTDRGYLSDTEIAVKPPSQLHASNSNTNSPCATSPIAENWILVNKDTDLSTLSRPQSPPNDGHQSPTLSSLVYNCTLIEHSPFALLKCWDSLAFIVRNVAHITPYNFESCVRCIRTFVEACRDGGIQQRRKLESMNSAAVTPNSKKKSSKRADREAQRKQLGVETGATDHLSDNEDSEMGQRYETLSIQLLDLMYTLYTRTAQIFRWWAEEGCAVPQCSALWAQGWCPLLQGIARLATDRRREVRTYAISCLQQRALLVHDLQTLSGAEWASCFHQVLFPLLNELLPESPSIAHLDVVLLEESRIRTATIMSKVFLHHLTPLIELNGAFSDLWIDILDYIEKFMKVGSDMLSEQMQEILKNMLLVMHSVRVFHTNDGTLKVSLWELTWQRIGEFLPQLQTELFHNEGPSVQRVSHLALTTSATTTLPTAVPSEITKAVTNICRVPTVDILPNSTHSQLSHAPVQLIASETIVEEKKMPQSPQLPLKGHSIILNPPVADLLQGQSILLGQLPPQPMLVPPQQRPSPSQFNPLPTVNATAAELENSNIMRSPASLRSSQQSTPESETLPDVINVASKIAQTIEPASVECEQKDSILQQAAHVPLVSTHTSFAIELCDDADIVRSDYEQIHQQQQYQHYYNHYQLQNRQYPPVYQQQDVHTQLQATESVSDTDVDAIAGNNGMPHEIETQFGSQYANIIHNYMVPANYSQSLQSQQQQQQQDHQPSNDIYQEYLQNPYNLAMQQDTQSPQHQQSAEKAHVPLSQEKMQTNVFASPANYFNINVDPSAIPPGSEMLYGQP